MQTRLDFSLEKHNYHVYVIWQRLNYWRPQNIFFRFLEGSLSRPIYGVVKPQYGENYASEVNINFPGWCPRGGGGGGGGPPKKKRGGGFVVLFNDFVPLKGVFPQKEKRTPPFFFLGCPPPPPPVGISLES